MTPATMYEDLPWLRQKLINLGYQVSLAEADLVLKVNNPTTDESLLTTNTLLVIQGGKAHLNTGGAYMSLETIQRLLGYLASLEKDWEARPPHGWEWSCRHQRYQNEARNLWLAWDKHVNTAADLESLEAFVAWLRRHGHFKR